MWRKQNASCLYWYRMYWLDNEIDLIWINFNWFIHVESWIVHGTCKIILTVEHPDQIDLNKSTLEESKNEEKRQKEKSKVYWKWMMNGLPPRYCHLPQSIILIYFARKLTAKLTEPNTFPFLATYFLTSLRFFIVIFKENRFESKHVTSTDLK